MATLYEVPVIDAPFQRLQTVLNGVAVQVTFAYNTFADRWSFGIEIEGVVKIAGRRLVPGIDLLKPFALGMGKLVLVQWRPTSSNPGRAELPAGVFRVIHYNDVE